MAATVVPRI